MGKIVKNIIIVLVAFLIITAAVAAFSGNTKIQQKSISDIVSLVDQGKVSSLTINESTVTVKLKDSDVQESAQLGGISIYDVLKNSGISTDKIRAVNIEVSQPTLWSSLAGPVLGFILPFALIALFIYFLMRQVQGSNNRALTFGQSSVRLNDERKNKVKFTDVAG
jgi:cell division protease FtsH